MQMVVWGGAAMTLLGIALLVYCILFVAKARREISDDAALKARLQKAVAINLGALALSGLGLGVVILGLALG